MLHLLKRKEKSDFGRIKDNKENFRKIKLVNNYYFSKYN